MPTRTALAKEKALARALKWQKENPQRRKEIRAKWIANNLEKMRAIRKAWKQANPDKVREQGAAWMRAHPETRAANEAKRRAIKMQAEGSFSEQEIETLYQHQKGRCANCKSALNGKFHRDHIVPLARGGDNWIGNIQLLCPTCNCKKQARLPLDFARENGRLL
jgi:5-methylcytosine-specific restriction endonuclease McrA